MEKTLREIDAVWYEPGQRVLIHTTSDKVEEYKVVECHSHYVVLTTGRFNFTASKIDLYYKNPILVYPK